MECERERKRKTQTKVFGKPFSYHFYSISSQSSEANVLMLCNTFCYEF